MKFAGRFTYWKLSVVRRTKLCRRCNYVSALTLRLHWSEAAF